MRTLATFASAWRRPRWVEEARSTAFQDRLAEVAAKFEPDIVHCEFHVMAQYILDVRRVAPSARCIVTEHEPGIVAHAGRGEAPTLRRRIGNAFRRSAWKRYERDALRVADAIIVFTRSDGDALDRLLGSNAPKIGIIALRLPLDGPPLSASAASVESDFLFIGSFIHPPNADAARRLVGSIFPRILKEVPTATLTIVGPNPPDDIAAASSDRVTVTGWVDDPTGYLTGAHVVLVPLRQGGGLRVKMLEACAAGKAIVASSTAIEGLDLHPKQDFVLADSDEEFAEAAVALIRDPARRVRVGKAAQLWSVEAQNRDAWAAEYANLYELLNPLSEHATAALTA